MKYTLHDCANSRNADALQSKRPKRRFEAGTPDEALTWKNAKQRSVRMFEWHCAVSNQFAASVRVIRIAWLLGMLCLREGYAFSTDTYISNTLGIPLNKVQQALTELERAGAIVRASHFVGGKAQRRIWPSTKIIPPTAGGIHTPRDDQSDTPHGGGTDSIEHPRKRKTARISSTADAAKRDAEMRESRAQQARGVPVQTTPVLEGEIITDDEVVLDDIRMHPSLQSALAWARHLNKKERHQ
jgi:hypothetical protein